MVNLKKETDEPITKTQETEQSQESTNDNTANTSTDNAEQTTSQETDTTQVKQQSDTSKKFSFHFTKQMQFFTAVSLVLLILVGFVSYRSGLNKNIAGYVYLLSTEYQEIYDKLKDTRNQLKENRDLLTELENYTENKEKLTESLNTKSTELENLNAQISQKQAELNQLTGNIAQAKGQPISLQAGQFIVGKDIPEGRYNVSGSSNFIVHDGFTGRIKVNTILGYGYVGDGDYICTLDNGDEINNHAPSTLTPIE